MLRSLVRSFFLMIQWKNKRNEITCKRWGTFGYGGGGGGGVTVAMLSPLAFFLLLLDGDFLCGGTERAAGWIATERFNSVEGCGETMGARGKVCNRLILASVEVLFKRRLLFKSLSDGISTGRERNHKSSGSASINICSMTHTAVIMAPIKNIFFQPILCPAKSRKNSFIRITARLSSKFFIALYYKVSTSWYHEHINLQFTSMNGPALEVSAFITTSSQSFNRCVIMCKPDPSVERRKLRKMTKSSS